MSLKLYSKFWFKTMAALIGLTIVGYLWWSGIVSAAFSNINQEQIEKWVATAGFWGPLIVVGLMMAAVVASPIPSAPIAIASGAAYGQFFGTIYVITGAFLGALIAFYLARRLGRKTMRRWFGERIDSGLLGSQNALTGMILVSRLIPFISFDMISYAAGLSVIRPWRFGLATLFGIIPMAFLMTHLGEMAMVGSSNIVMWFSLVLGILVSLPLFVFAFRKWRPGVI